MPIRGILTDIEYLIERDGFMTVKLDIRAAQNEVVEHSLVGTAVTLVRSDSTYNDAPTTYTTTNASYRPLTENQISVMMDYIRDDTTLLKSVKDPPLPLQPIKTAEEPFIEPLPIRNSISNLKLLDI